MARGYYQERGEAYEADICQRELVALPDDAVPAGWERPVQEMREVKP